MNLAALDASLAVACPPELRHEPAVRGVRHNELLRVGVARDEKLPLLVVVASTSKQRDGNVVYHTSVSSRASAKRWVVSYRFTQLLRLKQLVDDSATCKSPVCHGCCATLRQCLDEFFPRVHQTAAGKLWAVGERKHKLALVWSYLLACVYLPGNALKCGHAQSALPPLVFQVLEVRDEIDRRPVMLNSLYVHFRAVSSFRSEQTCTICLEDDEEDDDAVRLSCRHAFHRVCIATWLQREPHCPVCRQRAVPTAVANYCVMGNGNPQWWMTGFRLLK